MNGKFHFTSRGVTLVELMIAVSLLSIISLGIVGAFGNVAKAIQFTKTRTIASNLAQEQMQILKQKSFNRVLVTTAAVYVSNFGTDVPYDAGYYPPENITEGGNSFTRYTYVQVTREDSGALIYPTGSYTDTGMKAILVTVVWRQGTELKKIQLRNILSNIDTTMSNSIFSGKVQIWPGTTGIQGAKVTLAENVGYQDTTNASGNYSINAYPGNYTLVAYADGYFPKSKTVSITANSVVSTNFDMVAMGSGTVRGTVWLTDHLVISQVVGSSISYTVDASGFNQEWVELFNPSTYTWTIASNATTPVIDLIYQLRGSAALTISAVYNTLTIPAGGYYLFANTSTVRAVGINRTADAVFSPSNAGFPNLIKINTDGGNDAAGLGIAYTTSGAWIDRIGWQTAGNDPPIYEGAAIPQIAGLQSEEQYVRRSSTYGVVASLGRAYDNHVSSLDFIVASSPLRYPPRNSSDIETVVSGTPAFGAYVTATDGLSQVANAVSIGTIPAAEFQLMSVATGTWSIFIASASLTLDISTVTVTPNATVYVPNSLTGPTWPAVNYNASILSEYAAGGYIAGWVKDVTLLPISPAINVTATGSSPSPASISNGRYFLSVATGVYDVTANANNQNSSYVSLTSQTVPVALGQVTSGVEFILSQGGRIRGSSTRDGINPLPGIGFIASDINGNARAEGVSGADGQFLLINLSTGNYTIEPVLGSGEVSSPTSIVSTITAGATINVGTFTITGSFGSVRGSVTEGGRAIRTGVLIVASTATIVAPPTLSQASLTGSAYYTTNSYEDGSYVLDIRGSTVPYRVYGYYTTFSVNTPSTTVRSTSGISVTAGNATSNVNFSW